MPLRQPTQSLHQAILSAKIYKSKSKAHEQLALFFLLHDFELALPVSPSR
jgi:hypothetical protein